jgi:hypothetical protein
MLHQCAILCNNLLQIIFVWTKLHHSNQSVEVAQHRRTHEIQTKDGLDRLPAGISGSVTVNHLRPVAAGGGGDMIYKTFEQWKSGNVLEHGVPRTEHYTEDQLDLVEMGWNYGYDAGRAVEQALDKKAENARELGLDYEPVQDSTCSETLRAQGKAYPRTCRKCGKGPCIGAPKPPPAQPAPVQSCYCPNCEAMGKELAALKAQPAPVQEPVAIDGNTSDGYHTFNELYEFRKAYNAALFNEWAAGGKCSVHKSWRHHDNELCFGGGWFIVVAVLPQGQISNHYEAKDWDLFAVPEVERVLFEFDGHTGADVVERLKTYTTPSAAQPASVQPVAWMKEGWGPDCGPYIEFYRDDEMGWRDRKEWTPLYTTPPAQRQWVGLSEEEILKLAYPIRWQEVDDFEADKAVNFAQMVEAKLKEKNT